MPDTTNPGPVNARAAAIDLAVISFGLLFLEQACIRWIPSHLRLLVYFANLVLLAAFLGMGLGLLSHARHRLLAYTLPVLLGVVGVLNLFQFNVRLERETFGQNLFFGAETLWQDGFSVPFWVVVGTAFLLLAAIFAGPGQAMGRLFDSLPPLRAYSWNILGSIAGIAAFMGVSALSLSPAWWFALGGACVLWTLRDQRTACLVSLGCLVVIVGLVGRLERDAIWSPYNRITFMKDEFGNQRILVNNMSHQVMLPRESSKTFIYELPYLVAERAGRPLETGRTMVIGAGSGNDVDRMLKHDAGSVDAVEIDPRIRDIGRREHPQKPYADPRVHSTIDDGRAFLRRSQGQYDLIVYALVDSLSLLSQYSTIRLENYLFTKEAFEQIRDHLGPRGIFVAYNYYREAWLAARIMRTLEQVFGPEHCVMMTFPARQQLDENDMNVNTVIFMAGDVGKIRELMIGQGTSMKVKLDGVEHDIPLHAVETLVTHDLKVATDDWPFPYLRRASIPVQGLHGIAIVLVVSLLLLFGAGGVRPRDISPHYFCLGAAFMIIETEGIARLALLFGTTWINNSLTFLGILTIALVANVVAAKTGGGSEGKGRLAVYAALLGSLLLAFCVPLEMLLPLPVVARTAVALLLLFLPVFFGSLVFARSFKQSRSPHGDLGANILGAVAGGCLENLSGLLGFRNLLLVTALLYFLAMVTRPRATEAAAPPVEAV